MTSVSGGILPTASSTVEPIGSSTNAERPDMERGGPSQRLDHSGTETGCRRPLEIEAVVGRSVGAGLDDGERRRIVGRFDKIEADTVRGERVAQPATERVGREPAGECHGLTEPRDRASGVERPAARQPPRRDRRAARAGRSGPRR